MKSPKAAPSVQASTGIAGLDTILNGGFPPHWIYLVQGSPGTGKTTLGLQFLLEGLRLGERVLYITLSHTERELQEIARSHDWSLKGLPLYELSAGDAANLLDSDQSVFHSADVELGETMNGILESITRIKPERLVFDPIEQIRLLTDNPLRYRRQLLRLKQALTDINCTALFLTNDTLGEAGQDLESMVHGILTLERKSPSYGSVRRQLEMVKGRGMRYHEGYHTFQIRTGGLEVYPRLETTMTNQTTKWTTLKSGVKELDALLGGGLEEGTACLVVGPTGTGKTSVATLYAHAAAARGEHAAIFLFDERPETFYRRALGLGMDVRKDVKAGLIHLQQVNTGELSPGEFIHSVRQVVEGNGDKSKGVKVVVIDSLTGYLNAMPDDTLLIPQMHDLLTHLSQRGVLTLLIMAQSGVMGSGDISPLDISYLADAVLVLRHFESEGRIRRAISVIKKRHGEHEQTIRELRITSAGIQVGEPITTFSNILTGSPTFEGNRLALLDNLSDNHDEKTS
jgi:circadian clock protein KaiC